MDQIESQKSSIGYLSIVQLIAAIAVMYSHSYPLASGNGGGALIAKGSFTWGEAAVDVFLLISGLMVSVSFKQKHNVSQRFFEALRFSVKRIIKIVPVVWIVTLLAVLVVGPFFTELSVADYFRDRRLFDYLEALNPFVARFFLPGVFEKNFNHGVNGSLWVIPWQMWCYVAIFIMGLIGLHRNRHAVSVLCSLVWACYIGQDYFIGSMRFFGLPLAEGMRLFAFFMSGWLWRVWMPCEELSGRFALCLCLTLPFWLITPARDIALAVIGGYGLIALLVLPSCAIIDKVPRISFGVFVFGFVVQQGIVSLFGGHMESWLNFALSVFITIPMALAELCYIEMPLVKLRVRILKKIDEIENGRLGL